MADNAATQALATLADAAADKAFAPLPATARGLPFVDGVPRGSHLVVVRASDMCAIFLVPNLAGDVDEDDDLSSTVLSKQDAVLPTRLLTQLVGWGAAELAAAHTSMQALAAVAARSPHAAVPSVPASAAAEAAAKMAAASVHTTLHEHWRMAVAAAEVAAPRVPADTRVPGGPTFTVPPTDDFVLLTALGTPNAHGLLWVQPHAFALRVQDKPLAARLRWMWAVDLDTESFWGLRVMEQMDTPAAGWLHTPVLSLQHAHETWGQGAPRAGGIADAAAAWVRRTASTLNASASFFCEALQRVHTAARLGRLVQLEATLTSLAADALAPLPDVLVTAPTRGRMLTPALVFAAASGAAACCELLLKAGAMACAAAPATETTALVEAMLASARPALARGLRARLTTFGLRPSTAAAAFGHATLAAWLATQEAAAATTPIAIGRSDAQTTTAVSSYFAAPCAADAALACAPSTAAVLPSILRVTSHTLPAWERALAVRALTLSGPYALTDAAAALSSTDVAVLLDAHVSVSTQCVSTALVESAWMDSLPPPPTGSYATFVQAAAAAAPSSFVASPPALPPGTPLQPKFGGTVPLLLRAPNALPFAVQMVWSWRASGEPSDRMPLPPPCGMTPLTQVAAVMTQVEDHASAAAAARAASAPRAGPLYTPEGFYVSLDSRVFVPMFAQLVAQGAVPLEEPLVDASSLELRTRPPFPPAAQEAANRDLAAVGIEASDLRPLPFVLRQLLIFDAVTSTEADAAERAAIAAAPPDADTKRGNGARLRAAANQLLVAGATLGAGAMRLAAAEAAAANANVRRTSNFAQAVAALLRHVYPTDAVRHEAMVQRLLHAAGGSGMTDAAPLPPPAARSRASEAAASLPHYMTDVDVEDSI